MSNRYNNTFYLLNKLGRNDDIEFRNELCLQVSSGRVESLKELTDVELRELNNHLRRLTAAQPQDHTEMVTVRMRRKLFSIFHELGWETASGKPDYKRINEWLNKYGYLHKPLNDYTANELPRLLTQADNLIKSSYAKG